MGMPKSVTKINKDGVKFISDVDRVNYTIQELSRAALRDVSKLIRKMAKQKVPVFLGVLKSNIATWVRKDKRTGDVELHIGIYDTRTSKKKNKTPAYHAHLLEFGTAKMEAQPFLTPAVYDNINDIINIQAKYLSAIEDEQKAIRLIEEKDEVSDAG